MFATTRLEITIAVFIVLILGFIGVASYLSHKELRECQRRTAAECLEAGTGAADCLALVKIKCGKEPDVVAVPVVVYQ